MMTQPWRTDMWGMVQPWGSLQGGGACIIHHGDLAHARTHLVTSSLLLPPPVYAMHVPGPDKTLAVSPPWKVLHAFLRGAPAATHCLTSENTQQPPGMQPTPQAPGVEVALQH